MSDLALHTIKDEQGAVLASVTLAPSADLRTFIVSRVEKGKGHLLRYYFSHSGRRVRVAVGDLEFPGRLMTRWDKDRRGWSVSLSR